jgi:hypothetical protein
MRDLVHRLSTLGILAAVAVALVFAMGPSAVKEVWIYSYFRFAVLIALVVLAVYLGWSLRHHLLMVWNTVFVLILLSAFVAAELGLRVVPGIVPDDLLVLFPEPFRKEVAVSRGMFTTSGLQGEKMVYSYAGSRALPRQPWIKIDAEGYRNPTTAIGSVDVVLLGDSVMIAQSAKKDLGDHFRGSGLSAVNYGFGGYGLFQYRDVYRSKVLSRGIPHHWLVVMITFQNDVANSLHYLEVKASGGDWRDYLDRPTSFGWPVWADGRHTPLSVSAAIKLPFVLRQHMITAEKEIHLDMPRGTVMADNGIIWGPDIAPGSPERRAAESAIGDLVSDATRAKAKVILAFAPNSGLIYGPYAKDHEVKVEALGQNRRRFISFLNERFASERVKVVDLTDELRERAGVEPIGANELDYHLNDRGVEIVFDELRKVMGQ